VSGELALRCAACEAPLLADDRFCEACGAAVAGASPAAADATEGCRACGAAAGAVDPDGYCTVCGVRERPPVQRSELDLGAAAAVSEQGRTHRRNEDAFHLEAVTEGVVVAVVCDGISTAAAGDVAARAAAAAAGAVLAEALRAGGELEGATAAAALAAAEAVGGVPWTTRSELALPSCTLVTGACRPGEVVIGWVGDSRAYWVAPGEAQQLTVDDSWASEQVAEGLLSPAEAAADQRSHALTRWVGADAPPEAPQVTTLRPSSGGRLVLCSDGLWNYAPAVADLVELLEGVEAPAAPADVARHLAAAAMARGGRDDVTIAVIDVQSPGGQQP
jgi:PPM family protein phosphatase